MKRLLISSLLVGCSSLVFAQVTAALDPIHSGVFNGQSFTGNLAEYAGSLHNESTTDTVQINGTNINLAGNWDGMLLRTQANFDTISLAPDQSYYWGFLGGMFNVARDWNSSTVPAAGMYSATMDILGGTSDTATDVLATLSLQFELLADPLSLTQTVANPDQTTTPGGTSNYNVTLTAGSSPVWTWPVYSYMDAQLDHSNLGFVTWPAQSDFNTMLGAGESWTGDVISWTAAANTPNGTHHGIIRMMGGKYVGDETYMTASDVSWTVVPEPASMAVLGLGALALMRRRAR